ncbi:MAG: hypothetical protein H0X64_11730 [Gemmatimonadaceae bacterium]|nr:hypothetical protein [Gemmatimonadaceae bacterium]
MHVQYVTLCDQIILAQDGRPSLIGVFNHLNVPALPFTLPRLAFAGRILFTADETGRAHTVEVVITGPDGVELARPGGEISLPPAPAALESVAVDLPMQFDLFQVEAAGRYTFLLHVDGEKTAAVQLLVHLGEGG